jgi:hypothetical protein
MDDNVHNNGQHNADYNAGCYGKEKLEVPFLHEYIAGELPQEGNSLPED